MMLVWAQYQLWCGKNGWYEYKKYQNEIVLKEKSNRNSVERNKTIEAEIEDFNNGTEGIEESARFKHGFIKSNETYIRIKDATDD